MILIRDQTWLLPIVALCSPHTKSVSHGTCQWRTSNRPIIIIPDWSMFTSLSKLPAISQEAQMSHQCFSSYAQGISTHLVKNCLFRNHHIIGRNEFGVFYFFLNFNFQHRNWKCRKLFAMHLKFLWTMPRLHGSTCSFCWQISGEHVHHLWIIGWLRDRDRERERESLASCFI